MPAASHDVTDAELAVLQVLWDRGPSTIRQISDLLYPRGRTADYATVQKLLERLEGKRCVERRRAAPAHLFSATVARDELIGLRLRTLAEKLCSGSFTPLLTNLVKQQQLSPQERQSLRALLDELEAKRKRGYVS
jgi:BlaI family penicillinase repressor